MRGGEDVERDERLEIGQQPAIEVDVVDERDHGKQKQQRKARRRKHQWPTEACGPRATARGGD